MTFKHLSRYLVRHACWAFIARGIGEDSEEQT